MSCAQDDQVVELKAKRSFDESPVSFDWHDFLANLPQRGKAYASNDRVRLPRDRSTGLQYRCTTAGVTGAIEPRWPKVVALTVTDGSVVWTAEAVDAVSLRTTITSDTFEADSGVTLGAESSADLVYTVLVSGGTAGESYLIRHQIGCANGEDKEAIGRLPVED
jgi:hypothetical protein